MEDLPTHPVAHPLGLRGTGLDPPRQPAATTRLLRPLPRPSAQLLRGGGAERGPGRDLGTHMDVIWGTTFTQAASRFSTTALRDRQAGRLSAAGVPFPRKRGGGGSEPQGPPPAPALARRPPPAHLASSLATFSLGQVTKAAERLPGTWGSAAAMERRRREAVRSAGSIHGATSSSSSSSACGGGGEAQGRTRPRGEGGEGRGHSPSRRPGRTGRGWSARARRPWAGGGSAVRARPACRLTPAQLPASRVRVRVRV